MENDIFIIKNQVADFAFSFVCLMRIGGKNIPVPWHTYIVNNIVDLIKNHSRYLLLL